MATDQFSNLPKAVKLVGAGATFTALVGGSLALLSMANAINHARRAEKTTDQDKINSARRWSIRLGNGSLFVIIAASVLAAITICTFPFDTPSVNAGSSCLVQLQVPSGGEQVTSAEIDCYPRPSGADADMPSQVCVLKK
jgi:hypothetical protein